MIQIPSNATIFVVPKIICANEALDDVIAACKMCGVNPFSGDIFVFRDENFHHIGILSYDGQGFQQCIKRFSEGSLTWWPSDTEIVQIMPRDLQVMIWGGNPKEIEFPQMWKTVHGIKNDSGKGKK